MTVKTTGDKATLQEIKDAYGKQYGTPTPPAGFDNPEWLDSDLNTPAKGSYPPGSELFIGFNPIKTGYTAAVTLAGAEGGKREFITNDAWDGPQTLSGILTEAGITDPSNPGTPPTDWTFKGWAEADKYPEIIDPGTYSDPSTTYQSGTTFVAVYEVPYKINIGGTEYEVKVPVTAPNEGATWEQIKAAAKADSGILSNPLVSGDPAKLDFLLWSDGEGAPSKTGGKQYPANAEFTQQVEFKYSITDANGKTVEVNFGAKPSNTVITLDQIIAKAKENDTGADFGSDYSGNGLVKISDWNVSTSDPIAPGAEIKPISKELTYSVNKGETKGSSASDVKITLAGADATNAGSSLKDILQKAFGNTDPIADADKANAPDGKDIASGWKVTLPDGTEKIVSSKQINDGTGGAAGIFPPGTKIEPNWVTNADASLGGSDRTLTNLNDQGPKVGDGVTDDGKIIKKELVGKYIQDNGDRILGYIYRVNESDHKVKVVAKEVQPQKTWSYSDGSAVYKGVLGSVKLSDKIGSVESGFDGWIKITEYNSHAVYGNYQAVMYAICYPRKPSDDPIKYDESILGGLNSSNNPDNFIEAWQYNYKIDNVVNGDGYDNKWYLPAVTELMQIYGAKDALLNWTVARHSENGIGTTGIADSQTFWSVNVSTNESTPTSAQYVDFGAIGGPKAIDQNKYQVGSTKSLHYVLPVAEFRYEDYQVNH